MNATLLMVLLTILDLVETLGRDKFSPEQRKAARDARRAAMKAMREQE